MKLLIDIPEKGYNRIKNKTEVNYSEMWIAEGTPLDELTNGEVIQKILSDATVEQVRSTFFDKEVLRVTKDGNFIVCDLDWWNGKWTEKL